MYAFVDRPVADLGRAGKFVLWAMRGWIHAASEGVCPPGRLAAAFARHGALPALPHVHRLLAELNTRALENVAFLPLAHERIGCDEAVLLQLWADAATQPPRAHATLSLLIEEEAVAPAFDALLSAAARLGLAGLGPVAVPNAKARQHD